MAVRELDDHRLAGEGDGGDDHHQRAGEARLVVGHPAIESDSVGGPARSGSFRWSLACGDAALGASSSATRCRSHRAESARSPRRCAPTRRGVRTSAPRGPRARTAAAWLFVHADAQHRELVVADPRHEVAGVRRPRAAARRLPRSTLSAAWWPTTEVHAAEAVDVGHHQHGALALGACARAGASPPSIRKPAAVEQARDAGRSTKRRAHRPGCRRASRPRRGPGSRTPPMITRKSRYCGQPECCAITLRENPFRSSTNAAVAAKNVRPAMAMNARREEQRAEEHDAAVGGDRHVVHAQRVEHQDQRDHGDEDAAQQRRSPPRCGRRARTPRPRCRAARRARAAPRCRDSRAPR